MKKRLLFFGLLAASFSSKAQQVPTIGTSQGQLAIEYWSRAGNTNTNGTNNVFGTKFDSPIYTVTGSGFSTTGTTFRTKLNAIHNSTTQYLINGFDWADGVNTTGYLLIGSSGNSISNTALNNYQDKGAFSLLHLNGPGTSNQFQEYGYRPWMKTGITLTGNRDLSYIGLRQLGTDEDYTETNIVWSDNVPGSGTGEDEFAFRYISAGADVTTYNTDFSDATDFDGLHVSRFTGFGLMGLGNTFGQNTGVPGGITYNTPKSLLHMSYQYRFNSGTPTLNEEFGFMQVTYRREAGAVSDYVGQGESATDGLRLGIDNQLLSTGGSSYLNSYLRWQEASSFIIQTEDGGSANIEANERLRVTSIGALVSNHGSGYGGLTTPTSVTRIGVSHLGVAPITKPMSLLHLGYQATPGSDGYRTWMDLGMYNSNGTDQVYLGLKTEAGSGITGDRQDAVLNWGDNITGAGGPDNFRFIFTSAAGGGGTSAGTNGLEGMRLTPTSSTGVFTGVGGDPGANLYFGGAANPTATLEVNSWGTTPTAGGSSGLRFTNLNTSSPTVTNPGDGVLSVNANGDVIYVETSAPSDFGVICSDATGADFTANKHVELNGYNFYFSNNSVTDPDNNVGFGWDCGTSLKAKVDVYQNGPGGIGGSFLVDAGTTSYPFGRTGVSGIVYGGATNLSMGVEGQAITSDSDINIGVYGRAGGATNNYGVYGVAGSTPDFAGYFNGDVQAGGTYISSDSTLKNDITPLRNGLDIVNKLAPKTYYMDTENYSQFHFSDQLQYGFLAQEVAEILPSAVKHSVQPGDIDENGHIVYKPTEFLSLNYNAIIPINTQAIKELDQKLEKAVQELNNEVESKDAIIEALTAENKTQEATIEDLNKRLTQLENCLSGILPQLCQLSHSAVQSNTPATQEEVRKNLNVILGNRTTIVLDQNVPNPFAEQTVINFSIPATIQKAQIHFYDGMGKLIQSVDIAERGLGSLTVFAADLSNGTYTYTLVADGQVVATKKMMKQ